MSADPVDVRTYRALTHLYPRSFRREWGDDLVALFCDQRRDEATVRVWVRSVVDLAITIPTQHLEVRMNRTPNALVPLVFSAVALAGLALALLGGSEPMPVIIGAAVALVAGALAVVAWRRAAPARSEGPPIAKAWWKFLVVGPTLLAIGGLQNQFEFGNWYVWILMVLSAFVLTAIGLVLGIVELLTHRGRPASI